MFKIPSLVSGVVTQTLNKLMGMSPDEDPKLAFAVAAGFLIGFAYGIITMLAYVVEFLLK